MYFVSKNATIHQKYVEGFTDSYFIGATVLVRALDSIFE